MICPCSSAYNTGFHLRTRSHHASIHTSEEVATDRAAQNDTKIALANVPLRTVGSRTAWAPPAAAATTLPPHALPEPDHSQQCGRRPADSSGRRRAIGDFGPGVRPGRHRADRGHLLG
jgi:hypothetical protein